MSFRYLPTVPAVPTIEIEPPTTTVWGSPASVPSALAIAVVAALPPRRSAFRPWRGCGWQSAGAQRHERVSCG